MIYNPEQYLRLVFPKGFFSGKILNNELELKQAMMSALIKSAGISKRDVDETVYKVVDKYVKKIKELKEEGEKSYKKKALNNEVLLKNRLENLVLYNEVNKLKKEHEGQYYRWIPSSAEEPDPEHQLLYGKIFKVGEGDKDGNMPTERYGCRCGIEFLGDKKEVHELEGMEIEEPEIPIEAEFEEVKFKKAETLQEARKYTEKFMIDNNPTSWGKADNLENINTFNETIENLLEKYQQEGFEVLGYTPHGKFWAHANGSMIEVQKDFINGNKEYFEKEFNHSVTDYKKHRVDAIKKFKSMPDGEKKYKKYINQYEKDLNYSRYDVLSSPENMMKDVITHEFGHTLMDRAIKKEIENSPKIKTIYGERPILSGSSAPTYKKVLEAYFKAKENGDIYKISKYSSTNMKEFFAECFCAREIGENLPDYILKMIKEVAGK